MLIFIEVSPLHSLSFIFLLLSDQWDQFLSDDIYYQNDVLLQQNASCALSKF